LFREIFSSSSLNFFFLFSFLEFSWIFSSLFIIIFSLPSPPEFLCSWLAPRQWANCEEVGIYHWFCLSHSSGALCLFITSVLIVLRNNRERRGWNCFVLFAFVACIVIDQLLYTIAFGFVPWCLLSCSFCTLIALLILSFFIIIITIIIIIISFFSLSSNFKMLSLFISEFFSFPKTQQNKNEKKKKKKKRIPSLPRTTRLLMGGSYLSTHSFLLKFIFVSFLHQFQHED